MQQRTFCKARSWCPTEVGKVKEALDRLQRNATGPVEFESFVLTKHGMRRRIAWAYTRLLDSEGNLQSLVGTGIDITEKCDLEAKLQKGPCVERKGT